MNRGSAPLEAKAVMATGNFNEAPIHESGKSCAGERVEGMAGDFNEAPIHESGKSWRAGTARPDSPPLQ